VTLVAVLAACGGADRTPGPGPVDGPFAGAVAVEVGSSASGTIAAPGDVDYLTFTTSTAGTIRVALSGLSGDLDLVLYDASLTPVAVGEARDATAEALVYAAPAAGTFYVAVKPYGAATSSYAASVSLAAPDPFDTATVLPMSEVLGREQSGPTFGDLGASPDADYWVFDVTGPGTVVVLLDQPTADANLALYDGSRNLLGTSANAGTASEQIEHHTPAAGRFYVRVDAVAGPVASYVVGAVLVPDRTGEPNDHRERSTIIAVPSTTNAAISPAGDVDWYQLRTPGAGTLTVKVTGATADLDLELRAGMPVAASWTVGVADEAVTYEAPGAASYDVVVYSPVKGTSDYTLTVEFTASGADGNDSPGYATPVATPSTTPGTISPATDLDYLTFTTTTAGRITATLSGLSADLDLVLYDNWLAQRASGSTRNATGETLTYDAPAAGTFYVVVKGYASSTSDYTLDLAFTPAPPGRPNHTFDTATPLSMSWDETEVRFVPLPDAVGASPDAAYYVLDVAWAGTVSVAVGGAGADVTLTVYDAARNPVGTSTRSGLAYEEVVGVTTGATRLYAKVEAAAATDYSIAAILKPTRGNAEPNDTFALRTPVAVPSVTHASISPPFDVAGTTWHDVDWYELAPPGPGTLTVRVTGSTADLDLELRKDTMPFLASWTAGIADETIVYEVPAAGTYFAWVYSPVGASSDYTLTVEFTPRP
jgi:hypothetical protein